MFIILTKNILLIHYKHKTTVVYNIYLVTKVIGISMPSREVFLHVIGD